MIDHRPHCPVESSHVKITYTVCYCTLHTAKMTKIMIHEFESLFIAFKCQAQAIIIHGLKRENIPHLPYFPDQTPNEYSYISFSLKSLA